ncbi:MAG: M67 family metallopeptidase [Chloroflexi bacterium]|nr:M67 family metallopeptidase [Chloroflexota bacterium]
MDTVRIPRAFHAEMIAHAREGFPNEICGLIMGPHGELRELHRVRNAAIDPLYTYDMDPHELLRLNQRADDLGWEFTLIYHAHPPFAEAYPSATDVARAYYPDAVYVILAIGRAGTHLREQMRDPAQRAAVVAVLGDPQALEPRVRAYRIIKDDLFGKTGRIEELMVELV